MVAAEDIAAINSMTLGELNRRINALHDIYDLIIPSFTNPANKRHRIEAQGNLQKAKMHLIGLLEAVRRYMHPSHSAAANVVGGAASVLVPMQDLVQQLQTVIEAHAKVMGAGPRRLPDFDQSDLEMDLVEDISAPEAVSQKIAPGGDVLSGKARKTARASSDHFSKSGEAFKKGNIGTGIVQGAEALGDAALSAVESAGSGLMEAEHAVADVASKAAHAVTHFFGRDLRETDPYDSYNSGGGGGSRRRLLPAELDNHQRFATPVARRQYTLDDHGGKVRGRGLARERAAGAGGLRPTATDTEGRLTYLTSGMAAYSRKGIVDMHAGGEEYKAPFGSLKDPRPKPNYPAPALTGAITTRARQPAINRIKT